MVRQFDRRGNPRRERQGTVDRVGAIGQAISQSWPPFVLVAGLLMIGAVDEADGLFAALGVRAERLGGGPVVLLAALLGLEAVVTAVLNLDTAVVFMTPIALHAARQRECDVRPFLYGALFMANGASLLLPGSNLTNLIVLHHSPPVGRRVREGDGAAVGASSSRSRSPSSRSRSGSGSRAACAEEAPPLRIGIGVAATVAATVLILTLHNAALPVLAVGIVAVLIRRIRPRLDLHVHRRPLRPGGRARDARPRLGRARQAARAPRRSRGGGARRGLERRRQQPSRRGAPLGAAAAAPALAADRPQPRAEPGVHRVALGVPLVPLRAGLRGAAVAEDVVRARARARAALDRRRARRPGRFRLRRSHDEMRA